MLIPIKSREAACTLFAAPFLGIVLMLTGCFETVTLGTPPKGASLQPEVFVPDSMFYRGPKEAALQGLGGVIGGGLGG